MENYEKVDSTRQWKKGTSLLVGSLIIARIEQKCIFENRNIKV